VASGTARAEETVVQGLKKACHRELTTFRKGVTPGEARVLACLHALEDKVSDKCVYAVYAAALHLGAVPGGAPERRRGRVLQVRGRARPRLLLRLV